MAQSYDLPVLFLLPQEKPVSLFFEVWVSAATWTHLRQTNE
jgi:hypothetical protein